MIYAQNFSCETLRKGVFIAGAVFVVATMILNVYYYMYFTKATATQRSQNKPCELNCWDGWVCIDPTYEHRFTSFASRCHESDCKCTMKLFYCRTVLCLSSYI
ncbi:hypothetical protein SLEP1_g51212 [Rubroshorea leprosula]|nr:hypothetical protein SLEP1_g51212 [Rubroshorea leprosula]